MKNILISLAISLLLTTDIISFLYFFATTKITIFAISGTITIFLAIYLCIYSFLKNLD